MKRSIGKQGMQSKNRSRFRICALVPIILGAMVSYGASETPSEDVKTKDRERHQVALIQAATVGDLAQGDFQ